MKQLHFRIWSEIPFKATAAIMVLLSVLVSPAMAATDVWTGGGSDSNLSDTNNWTGNVLPAANDMLLFTESAGLQPTNDFPAGTAFNAIDFDAGADAFTLVGNGIMLSGATGNSIRAANITNGIVNAGSAQENINLDITLDWGIYQFASPSFVPVSLNGALQATPGGVGYFYFDGAITASTSITNDFNGLISGLGGSGLMAAVANGKMIFTAPATINGGVVSTYGYGDANGQIIFDATPITSGSNYNVQLDSTTPQTYYLSTNTYLNTIMQPLQINGGAGDVIMTGVNSNLIMGVHGAILATVGNSGDNSYKNQLNIGGGGYITAGGGILNTPATLVFGVNGAGVGGSMYISNSLGIKNNGSGAVTVVKVGTGSMILGKASTYSGGTYLNEGYIQCNDNGSFGVGDVYIASGAGTVLPQANSLFPNNFHLAPGQGVPTEPLPVSVLLRLGNNVGGKITLQGPPATYPDAGCRIGLQETNVAVFSGQITGPGTLELMVGSHATNTTCGFTFSNITANANNWTGGLILSVYTNATANSGNTNAAFTTRLAASNQLAGNTVTMLPIRYTNRLDLNGFNDTIGALITASNANSANIPIVVTNVQVVNYGISPATLTLGAGNASGVFAGLIGDGGPGASLSIVKSGGGTQTFAGPCSYTGNTTINAGTLALSNSATLTKSSSITLAAGARLDTTGLTSQPFSLVSGQTLTGAGAMTGNLTASANSTINLGTASSLGTLSVTGNVVLNGNLLMKLNRLGSPANSDHLVASGSVTYGGALVVTNIGSGLQAGDTFHLFGSAVSGFSTVTLATNDATGNSYTWSNKLGVDGSIQVLSVVSPVNLMPTNITVVAVSGALELSWPADHTGWRLQSQTNSMQTGLGTNWVDVPGSASTNKVAVPINPINGAVFYRMIH